MQRTTAVGLRSWSECDSFCPTLEEAPLKRVYRQNPSLLRIAARLYEEARHETPPFDSPFEPGDDPSALLFEAPNFEERIGWVADRIVEIYGFCGQLPTIAVFVSDDAAIDRVARVLSELLRPNAIAVDACPGGKFSVGDRVRVFAIEYVKGLEFQAAFLIDVEDCFAQTGGLALNFVYVAVSRAVMFLGLTGAALPTPLECLRPLLVKGTWSHLSPLEGDETDED
jgi:superfamily I DNA/RNA helicase